MKDNLYKSIGERIRTARERMNLSQEQLARRLGYTSPATISHFESGSRKISVADLQLLTRELGLPLDYFIEDAADEEHMAIYRLRAKTVQPGSREEFAQFLSFASKNSVIPHELDSKLKNMKAGGAAEFILKKFGIEEPPVSPFRIAQRLDISVFQWDFPDEISGVFVSSDDKVCIGVNENHPLVRQRFTVAHELGHFVFHREIDMFIDFTDPEMAATAMDEHERELETKANWFAADLLMPREWIYRDFEEYGEENLLLMAQDYDVSEQALWFRLKSLKLVINDYV